jgi:hypothetical protein
MGALSTSDFLVSERGGVPYKLTGQELLDFIRGNFGTTDYRVADITARNALADLTMGDIVLVDDASADTSVITGWGMYRNLSGGTWQKIAEEESIDVTITITNLGVTRTASAVTVTNSDGTDATIPVATNTEAGVMSAVQVALLELLTVTNAVNLDDLASDSHKKAYASGTASTNPITVDATTQAVGFSISQLADLPV